ncbi:MAG: DNA repair protein RecN [Prevotella sp.]
MLKHLYIKDFTLIDELDISFGEGFSVITGETGAGKSIVLGALGLLLGNRADIRMVKEGRPKCIVEAVFDVSHCAVCRLQQLFQDNELDELAEECIVRREISAAGKSRAFVNDTPVGLGVLKVLGEHLIDIHSQHQNLLLSEENFQMSVLDTVGHTGQVLSDYQDSFAQYSRTRQEVSRLRSVLERNREAEDFLRFQYKELSDAQLEDGEQERLEAQSKVMEHAEEIKSALYRAKSMLDTDETGVVDTLRSLVSVFEGITVYPEADEWNRRIDSCYIELKDIAQEVTNGLENVDFDPGLLEQVANRLDTIYTLQQKYKMDSISLLLDKLSDLKRQIGQIDNGEEQLQELEGKERMLKEECLSKAGILTAARRKAAHDVETELVRKLAPLELRNASFRINLDETPLTDSGADNVTFLFSANAGSALQPIAQVASGGEVARVMLALKSMLSSAADLPTIIFDEIDTGVSGRIAEQMARMMREMGRNGRQVISITHLPQIAAMGGCHYKVAKKEYNGVTTSSMSILSETERVTEIAQMLSGSTITAAAIDNAKSLLNNQNFESE